MGRAWRTFIWAGVLSGLAIGPTTGQEPLPAPGAPVAGPDGRSHDGQTYPSPYPGGAYRGRATASVVVEHSDLGRVVAVLGVVGDPFPPVPLRLRSRGPDFLQVVGGFLAKVLIGRPDRDRDGHGGHRPGPGGPRRDDDRRGGDRDGRWGDRRGPWNPHDRDDHWFPPPPDRRGYADVDLAAYTPWMDGVRPWYLRLTDCSGRSGRLLSFSIRTDAGVAQVWQVPAWFGPGNGLEARVTPQIVCAWPSGQPGPAPYPAPYPATVQVVRSLPAQAWPGQPFAITYDLLGWEAVSGYARLQVQENLPPQQWQILRVDPPAQLANGPQPQLVWDLYPGSPVRRLTVEVVVGPVNGWQFLAGNFRLNDDRWQSIAGRGQIWIGGGYPQ